MHAGFESKTDHDEIGAAVAETDGETLDTHPMKEVKEDDIGGVVH
jgi:hypothetical protein